ncbi:RNA polymerase II elongation factor ELL2 [Porphyrio hochstetteri]
MAELREGERYGVSCGKAPGITVLHVRLAETALRALEDYRRCQDAVSSAPSILFQGSQGLLRIPKVDVPNEVQTFNFYTSCAGSDNPRGSFDCVQQTRSSSGASQLSCLGPVQSKITVCATSDFCQTTRERVTQAEEELRNRSAKVINPGRPPLGKRPPVRKPRLSSTDFAPERKRSTPLNPALIIRKTHSPNAAVSQRPCRERVMHLLALRSYRTPELLARLQKDGVKQEDKNCLGRILQQVANLNPKDNSYTLKDYLYKEIKKDWPGYNEIDKQSLKLKLSNLYLSQNATSTGCEEFPVTSGMDGPSTSETPAPDASPDPCPDPCSELLSHVNVRVLSLLEDVINSRLVTPGVERGVAPRQCRPGLALVKPVMVLLGKASFSPGLLAVDLKNKLLGAASSSSPSAPEGQGTRDLPADRSRQKSQSLSENQQHKQSSPTAWGPGAPAAGRPPRSAEKPGVLDTTRAKEENGHKISKAGKLKSSSSSKPDEGAEGTCTASPDSSSASEQPDYILKYTAIESYRQRESYKDDFNAEYGEYRALHARVETVVQRFVELDAQHKLLSPGTKEHQKPTLETGAEPPVCLSMNGADVDVKDSLGSVSETERPVAGLEALGWLRLRRLPHMLGSTPSYDKVKSRCMYLHKKLSHINRLIEEFNQHEAEVWHQSLDRKKEKQALGSMGGTHSVWNLWARRRWAREEQARHLRFCCTQQYLSAPRALAGFGSPGLVQLIPTARFQRQREEKPPRFPGDPAQQFGALYPNMCLGLTLAAVTGTRCCHSRLSTSQPFVVLSLWD